MRKRRMRKTKMISRPIRTISKNLRVVRQISHQPQMERRPRKNKRKSKKKNSTTTRRSTAMIIMASITTQRQWVRMVRLRQPQITQLKMEKKRLKKKKMKRLRWKLMVRWMTVWTPPLSRKVMIITARTTMETTTTMSTGRSRPNKMARTKMVRTILPRALPMERRKSEAKSPRRNRKKRLRMMMNMMTIMVTITGSTGQNTMLKRTPRILSKLR